MSGLLQLMNEVVTFAHSRIPLAIQQGKDPHHNLCVIVAKEYHLLDHGARFPLWLSRIVRGVLDDYDESHPSPVSTCPRGGSSRGRPPNATSGR